MATEHRIPNYSDVPTLVEARHHCRGAESLRPGRAEGLAGQAMGDPAVGALLDSYIQTPWYKSPAECRVFAEMNYAEVKPLLIKAGLAKG